MTSALSQLDYENRNAPRPGEAAYRTAVFCGAFPLVLGVSILVGFYTTAQVVLALAGLGTILLGCLMFLIGMGALIGYWRACIRADGRLSRRNSLRVWLTLLLLLINFPAAWICADIGISLLPTIP